MRNILTTLALTAGMSLMAQSADQKTDKKTPEERAKHQTEWMTKELGLDAEQIAKVNTINLNYARYIFDVARIEDAPTREGRQKALESKRDAELRTVLNDDQYTRMLEVREKKEAGAKEKKEKKGHQE